MEHTSTKTVIEVCMGSSCFSRGNKKNIDLIKSYIAEYGHQAIVVLKGALCQEQCTSGPNIRIGGEMFNAVEPNTLYDLLDYHLKGEG